MNLDLHSAMWRASSSQAAPVRHGANVATCRSPRTQAGSPQAGRPGAGHVFVELIFCYITMYLKICYQIVGSFLIGNHWSLLFDGQFVSEHKKHLKGEWIPLFQNLKTHWVHLGPRARNGRLASQYLASWNEDGHPTSTFWFLKRDGKSQRTQAILLVDHHETKTFCIV